MPLDNPSKRHFDRAWFTLAATTTCHLLPSRSLLSCCRLLCGSGAARSPSSASSRPGRGGSRAAARRLLRSYGRGTHGRGSGRGPRRRGRGRGGRGGRGRGSGSGAAGGLTSARGRPGRGGSRPTSRHLLGSCGRGSPGRGGSLGPCRRGRLRLSFPRGGGGALPNPVCP
jgi:hypothetical protein